jgi:deoxyribodipyrimidine photolyase-related protein
MADSSEALARHRRMRSARRLLMVLGDQLDLGMPALDALDRERDAVLMAEVRGEAEHVPSHRQRTALFLSAMRHFALELIERGYRVRYVRLDAGGNTQCLGGELGRAVATLAPECVRVVRPGEHRVLRMLEEASVEAGVPLEVLGDTSFTCPLEEFEAWANDGRKTLVMEYFYRERRRRLGVLIDDDGKPVGGQWNFDAENREAFREAPDVRPPYRPRPDTVTREVLELVDRTFPDAPGCTDGFDWPVTRAEGRRALRDFIEHRLHGFGTYEDAMWAGEPVLYHSRLSSSLNLKLLSPGECIDAALHEYATGRVPLNDVEGFVRQLIGWREFIRGVYYREGLDYLRRNGLGHHGELPGFYWTGDTDMSCLRHCLGEVVRHAWSHHIPRLMVIGNFALTAGVHPGAVNDWFLAMYVDAVDWVTAPNVLGMSQHADHGVVGTKPYAASGKYINRMSNYCGDCPYHVSRRTGDDACPFNIFYWDFLIRHRDRLADNRRMAMILKNVDRLDDAERQAIRSDARRLRRRFGIGGVSR